MLAVATPLARFRVFADRVAGRLAAEDAAHGPGRQPRLEPVLVADLDQLGHVPGFQRRSASDMTWTTKLALRRRRWPAGLLVRGGGSGCRSS